jgi:acid phosphatase class B
MRLITTIITLITLLFFALAPIIIPLPATHTNTPLTTTTTTPTTPAPYTIIAAFDLDDTLLHSSPSFTGNYHKDTGMDWYTVNGTTPSLCTPLTTGTTILQAHQSNHNRNNTKVYTYIVTARPSTNTQALTQWLIDTYHVHGVYYTGKANGVAKINKATVLTNLANQHHATHTYYYGDSDSDIKAGLEAHCITTRIQRPPYSNYKRSNNPGIYNEPIIPWNSFIITPREFGTSTQTPLKENNMAIFIVLFIIMVSITYMHNHNQGGVFHMGNIINFRVPFTITGWIHTNNKFMRYDNTYHPEFKDHKDFAVFGAEEVTDKFPPLSVHSPTYISACLGLEYTNIYCYQYGIQHPDTPVCQKCGFENPTTNHFCTEASAS